VQALIDSQRLMGMGLAFTPSRAVQNVRLVA
jgi:hypothetical protein